MTLRGSMILLLVVLFSITLPTGIGYFTLSSALIDKPLGDRPHEETTYWGTLKNGELWFLIARNEYSPRYRFRWRLKRLDLETGIEHDTGIRGEGGIEQEVWVGDELYLIRKSTIECVSRGMRVEIAERPQSTEGFLSCYFPYDRELTTVLARGEGKYQLVHLRNGQWFDGRWMRLPGRNFHWEHDRQDGPDLVSPPVPVNPKSNWVGLSVIPQGAITHVCLFEHLGDFAYRKGFDFIDDETAIPSAMTPANSIHKWFGWEPVDSSQLAAFSSRSDFYHVACDREGLILKRYHGLHRLFRRDRSGRLQPLLTPDGQCVKHVELIAPPTENGSYLLDEFGNTPGQDPRWDRNEHNSVLNHRWKCVTVHRINGNTVFPEHLRLRGTLPFYFNFWRRLLGGCLLATLMYLGIWTFGTSILVSQNSNRHYEFGFQQVALASIWRRAAALIVDSLLATWLTYRFC